MNKIIEDYIKDLIDCYILAIKNNVNIPFSNERMLLINFSNILNLGKNIFIYNKIGIDIFKIRGGLAHQECHINDLNDNDKIIELIELIKTLDSSKDIIDKTRYLEDTEKRFITNKEIYEVLINLNIPNIDKFTRIINSPKTKRFLDESNYININKKYIKEEDIYKIESELNMKFPKCVYLRVHENIIDEDKIDNHRNSILNWD